MNDNHVVLCLVPQITQLVHEINVARNQNDCGRWTVTSLESIQVEQDLEVGGTRFSSGHVNHPNVGVLQTQLLLFGDAGCLAVTRERFFAKARLDNQLCRMRCTMSNGI